MCIINALYSSSVEGRGLAKGEVGMASLDLKRPELLLSQVLWIFILILRPIKSRLLFPFVLELSAVTSWKKLSLDKREKSLRAKKIATRGKPALSLRGKLRSRYTEKFHIFYVF